jgi:hypothetical protein
MVGTGKLTPVLLGRSECRMENGRSFEIQLIVTS